jgi:transketolase
LGQAGSVFGLALPEYMSKHGGVKVVSADMSRPAGLDRFKNQYPNDFYNTGIAEQNMLGVAAGLASEGYTTVAEAQACFLSMRSFEQVRQYMGYMQFPIVCVGINSGFSLTFFGNSHYAIEDMAIMRAIPNVIVLSASDASMAVALFEKALNMHAPVYLRLAGGLNSPIVYNEQPDVRSGGSNVLREGKDVVLLATGSMVHNALQAAELLSQQGVETKVVDIYSLKPIDKEQIESAIKSKLVVTIEEHNIIGGLGGAVAELLAGMGSNTKLLRLGVKDQFATVGDYTYLLAQNRLTADLIAEDVLKNL